MSSGVRHGRHELEDASWCWSLTWDLASRLLVDQGVGLLLGLLDVLLVRPEQFDLLLLPLGRRRLGLGLQEVERLAGLLYIAIYMIRMME